MCPWVEGPGAPFRDRAALTTYRASATLPASQRSRRTRRRIERTRLCRRWVYRLEALLGTPRQRATAAAFCSRATLPPMLGCGPDSHIRVENPRPEPCWDSGLQGDKRWNSEETRGVVHCGPEGRFL